MATMPPNQPPPYPPPQPGMDPRDYARAQKDYYRAWKQQQKDAWRANRDQWRSQRDQFRDQRNAWYGRRRSLVGPVILISIGIIFFLIETGRMESGQFWDWFGHWWPLLLIAAGIGRLIEWVVDRDSPYPPRSSGFGGLIALIVIAGIVATGAVHARNHGGMGWMNHFDMDDNDMSFFHGPEHDYDGETDAVLPAGNSVQIVNSGHGDVSVTTGEAGKLHVMTHKKVHTNDEQRARREADAYSPVISNSGNVTTIRLNPHSDDMAGNMEIVLPADVIVNVLLQHGDLTMTGQRASVSADTHHGDLRFTDITGNVVTKADHGDLNVNGVHGDVTLNGTYDDINVSQVSGRLTMDGDFPGDLNLRNIDGPLHFHTSRTDLDVARIVDQLTIDSGDLHGSMIAGPFRLKTHDYNVDLKDVSGEVNITDRDNDVDIVAANPLGSISVDNHAAGIRVTLPENAGFTLDAATDGDISNDFGIGVNSNNEHKTARGSVGNGLLKIALRSNENDISVRRATGPVATVPQPGQVVAGVPAVPAVPGVPAVPAIPRRLSSRPAAPKAPAPPAPEIANQ